MLDALHMLQIDRKIQYVLFGMKMNTHMRLQSEDSDDNISPVNQNGHCVYILPTLPPMGGFPHKLTGVSNPHQNEGCMFCLT